MKINLKTLQYFRQKKLLKNYFKRNLPTERVGWSRSFCHMKLIATLLAMSWYFYGHNRKNIGKLFQNYLYAVNQFFQTNFSRLKREIYHILIPFWTPLGNPSSGLLKTVVPFFGEKIFFGQVAWAKKFYLFKNRKFTPSRKRRYLAQFWDLEALTPAPKTGVKKIRGGPLDFST